MWGTAGQAARKNPGDAGNKPAERVGEAPDQWLIDGGQSLAGLLG